MVKSRSAPAAKASPLAPKRLLRRALWRNRGRLSGAFTLITCWQVCEAMVPVLIGVIIDRAVATGDVGSAVLWAVVLAVHFAVLSTSYRLGSRLANTAGELESHRLRTEVSAHALNPNGVRTDHLSGDVLTIATADADMVGGVIRQVVLSGAALTGLAVGGIALASIDWVLALLVLLGVPIVLGLSHLLSQPLTVRSQRRQEAVGKATGTAADLVRGLRTLKGIRGEDVALSRYRVESRKAVGEAVGAARWEGALFGVTDALSVLFLAAVALVAGTRALEGDLGIGELIAVVGLAQFVAEPMTLLSYLIAEVAQSRASANRISDYLDRPVVVHSGDLPGSGRASLELAAVTRDGLRDVSLTVSPGETVALIVDDPADAATLMALLRGDSVPDAGEVLLGDVSLTDLRLDDVRRDLLVADHHVDLFAGALRDNIDPTERCDERRLADVLAASAADDVVDHAPEGLATHVVAGGTSLSGGQRQRVALARAMVRDAPVTVFHDPTTAVDAVTEQRVALGMRRLRGSADRATLVLTSSPALLAAADRVVHLRDGRVAAVGEHVTLLEDEDYRTAVLR